MKILKCPSCGKAVVINEQHFEPCKQLACVACHYSDYGYAFLNDYKTPHNPLENHSLMSLLSVLEMCVNNGELDHFPGRGIDQFIHHQAQKFGLSHHTVFELLNTTLSRRRGIIPINDEVSEAMSSMYCVQLTSNNSVSVDDLLNRIEDLAQRLHKPSQLSVVEEAYRLELSSLKNQLRQKTMDYDDLYLRHKKLLEMNKLLKEKLSDYE